MKTISNDIIRQFNPCYDPASVGIPENETLTVTEWVAKYRDTVKKKEDTVWLLCHNEFLSNRDLRLFAVWCAREALKLDTNPDQSSVAACDVAERYANGEATDEELTAARKSARISAWESARASARESAWESARENQIDKLLTYFDEKK